MFENVISEGFSALIDGTLRFELWSHDTLLETCELNVE